MKECNRRAFLRMALGGCVASAGLPLLYPCGKVIAGEPPDEKKEPSDDGEKKDDGKTEKKKKKISKSDLKKMLAVAEGDDPEKMTRAAIEALGGIDQFVKKNKTVVIKPNIAWDRKPEEAATTNPQVVAAIVKECVKAGAKKVYVFDRTCQSDRVTYKTSGISKAAEDAGAKVLYVNNRNFKETKIPKGKSLKSWPLYEDALKADVFINVPIAKHHGISKLTMGFKNLMGIMGGSRGSIHRDIHEKLVDVATVAKPHLTILDAYRVLTARGPQGGGSRYVKTVGKIVAGVDMVAVDSYGVTLFNQFDGWKDVKAKDISYIKKAYDRKLGEMRLDKLEIVKC